MPVKVAVFDRRRARGFILNKYATIKCQPDQKTRILLISNNTRQHEHLLQSLLAGAFRVSVAADGVQGYTKAQLTLPELILMDKQVGGIDALSLTHMLQGLKATAHIPIIILDSRSESSSEECVNFLKAGAVDYIGNPYAVDEVKERINVPLRNPKQALSHLSAGKTLTQRPSTTAETSMLIYAIQKNNRCQSGFTAQPERTVRYVQDLKTKNHEYISAQFRLERQQLYPTAAYVSG